MSHATFVTYVDADAFLHPTAPSGLPYRSRESAHLLRTGSPAWDITMVRIARRDKVRLDVLRKRMEPGGRIPPHWAVLERLLNEAEARYGPLGEP